MVNNASWSPKYELRATSTSSAALPASRVVLHYRAAVQQSTGEDWRNARITVSTAAPGRWERVPHVRRMHVEPGQHFHPFGQKQAFGGGANNSKTNNANVNTTSLFGSAIPNTSALLSMQHAGRHLAPALTQQQRQAPVSSFGGFGSTATREESATGSAPRVEDEEHDWTAVGPSEGEAEPADDDAAEWSATKTVVRASAVASTFRVSHACTIPSGQAPHHLAIAAINLDADIRYVVVPRTVPEAFVEVYNFLSSELNITAYNRSQCKIVNHSEYRLLPGPLSVFLDDLLVSKTQIQVRLRTSSTPAVTHSLLQTVGHEQSFRCTFGPSPALRVTCTRPPRSVVSGTSYVADRTLYRVQTRVQNTSNANTVTGLCVRDAAPIAREELAKQLGVTVVKPHALQELVEKPKGELRTVEVDAKGDAHVKNDESGDAEDGEKKSGKVQVRWDKESGAKEGRYEWLVDLAPGESVLLEAEYEVSAASHVQWFLREDIW